MFVVAVVDTVIAQYRQVDAHRRLDVFVVRTIIFRQWNVELEQHSLGVVVVVVNEISYRFALVGLLGLVVVAWLVFATPKHHDTRAAGFYAAAD